MRFRYLRDPLFLVCVALFLVNKLLLRRWFELPFFHGQLNDCICVAVWVPLVLSVMRVVRMRGHDRPPQAMEILIPVLLWSWYFEVWLPQQVDYAGVVTADPWDVLCYVVEGMTAGLVWRWYYQEPMIEAPPPAGRTVPQR
jgi:hypothetical protein